MMLTYIQFESHCLVDAALNIPDYAVQFHAVRRNGVWTVSAWVPFIEQGRAS